MTAHELAAAVRREAARPRPRGERARAVAEAVRGLGGYRWVGVYDVGPAEIAVVAWSGAGPPAHPRFPRAAGLNGRAVAAGKTVVVDDVAADPDYLETLGDTRAELVVPVLADGLVVGTIDVESDSAHAFTPADTEALEACARAAVPLWRAR